MRLELTPVVVVMVVVVRLELTAVVVVVVVVVVRLELTAVVVVMVVLTRLDHSHQKGKGFVGRSGALSQRRPPSRGSRRSSTESLSHPQNHHYQESHHTSSRVVNIPVHLEGDLQPEAQHRHFECTTNWSQRQCNSQESEQQQTTASRDTTQQQPPSKHPLQQQTPSARFTSCQARKEARRKLLEQRSRRTLGAAGGSNPLLNTCTTEAEETFRRIKEEVARLAAKRRSSTDVSDTCTISDTSWQDSVRDLRLQKNLRGCTEEHESLLDSASVALERNADETRSSSEADVVISDRESIADSGLVNRRTVITISQKKSKSATSLTSEDSTPLWIRDLQTRRSLRSNEAASRLVPIQVDPDFQGGINVSIVSQADQRKDSTSRMYVRQSDSENRPSRASAFNVRQTIEKRQIQQERRERRALRERIREQIRSLSEGRERKDSSSSHVSSLHSQNSVRSKSLSSLEQDQDDHRSESPLIKVQSSPTLEKEKEEVRSYLFGVSNLTESGDSSQTIYPLSGLLRPSTRSESSPPSLCSSHQVRESSPTQDFERIKPWQWARSWDALKAQQQGVTDRSHRVCRSVDSVQETDSVSLPSSVHSSSVSGDNWRDHNPNQLLTPPQKPSPVNPQPIGSCGSDQTLPNTCETKWDTSYWKGDESPTPIPPPRRHRLSLSTGQIKLEEEEKPSWIRLAKERRSLRTARQVDQLSDRASTASKEPEWVARARKKLENLNVTLTSTTDFNCASSVITESSSAWSRGGLDALDDLREETSRIGEELAEEATARLNQELGLPSNTTKMLEHTQSSQDPSVERPRVSFDATATEASDGDSTRRLRCRKPPKEEVRFGDLKHDWGGAQTKGAKTSNGKQKEMRFGEVEIKETPPDTGERSRETRFGDQVISATTQKSQTTTEAASEKRPVMRFGDTPLNMFHNDRPRGNISSSKFESVSGPDPTKMTAEQLNQNVEEYDFPIPTGKEDASELMKFLEDSLKKVEVVPEVVCSEDSRPKPKSILKRRSVENVMHELKSEEQGEWLQKVEHRKSASFDWDRVGKGGDAGLDTTHTKTPGHSNTTKTLREQLDTSVHNNNIINNKSRSPHQHNTQPTYTPTTTSTPTATNASFFNVKLRHVSPNSRQPSSTNDSLRFHSEHSIHRRTHGVFMNTDRHSDDFSLTSLPSAGGVRRNTARPVNQGGGSQGSSPASSLESLSDSGGHSPPPTGQTCSTVICPSKGEQEEQQHVMRRLRVKERQGEDDDDDDEEEEEEEDNFSGQDSAGCRTGVKGRLQRMQEPPPPPAWATCRSGRTFTTAELNGDSIPAMNLPTLTHCKEEEAVSSSESVNSWPDILHNPAHSNSTRCDSSGLAATAAAPSPPPQQSSITTIAREDSSSTFSFVNEVNQDSPVVVSSPTLTPQHHSSITTITSEDNSVTNNSLLDRMVVVSSPVLQQHSSITTIKSSSSSVMNEIHADGLVMVTSPTPQHSSITSINSSAPSVINQVFVDGECHFEVVGDISDESSQHNKHLPSLLYEGEETRETPPSTPPTIEGTNSPEPLTTIQATNMTLAAACSATHPLIPLDLTPATEAEEKQLPCQNPHTSPAPSPQQGDTPTQTPQANGTPHNPGEDPVQHSAKVFSFTFSPDQKTRPETTFRDLDGDSLIHLKRQKEAENMRRTEGAKIFTIITNPNDVQVGESSRAIDNFHSTASLTPSSPYQASKIRSLRACFYNNDSNTVEESKNLSPATPTKPARTKQHVGLSGEQRKGEERETESRRKGDDREMDNVRKGQEREADSRRKGEEREAESRRKVEDRKTDSGSHSRVHEVKVEVVDEEEARRASQRRREEKRRGSLLEWEAIQRQRLEEEERNRINKNLSMKPVSAKIKELVKMHGSFMSMFTRDKKTDINGTVDGKDDIVFKKISPENFQPQMKGEVVKEVPITMRSPYMVKRVTSPGKDYSPRQESQHISRRDSSSRHRSPSRKASPSPRRLRSRSHHLEDKRDQASHRILTESNWKTSHASKDSPDLINLKLRSSVSPSRRKRTNITSSSPDRKSRSKERISYPKSSKIIADLPDIFQPNSDDDSTLNSANKASPPIPPKPIHLQEKSQAYPSSYHKTERERTREQEERDHTTIQDTFSHDKRQGSGRTSIKDPKNRKDWLNKMLNTLIDEPQDAKELSSSSKLNLKRDSEVNNEPVYETIPSVLATPIPPARKSSFQWTSAEPTTSAEKKFSSLTVKSASSVLMVNLAKPTSPAHHTKTDPEKIDIPPYSKSSLAATCISSSLVNEETLPDPSQLHTPSRGPVSLSSILGDSSRSSSLTSTPLGSPRVTPERMFKRDSTDLTSKLDVILESRSDERRGRLPVKEQKENIAPPPSERLSDLSSKDTSGKDPDSPFRSSFRYRETNEEKQRVLHKEAVNESSHKTSTSWQPSEYKPFTFAKSSVTVKSLTSGLEKQASNNKELSHKESVNSSIGSSQKFSPDNTKALRTGSDFASRIAWERNSRKAKSHEMASDKAAKTTAKTYSQEDGSHTPRRRTERSSMRSKEHSGRSTPDTEGIPVSLSSILSREISKKGSITEEPSEFTFKPKLSFSEELNDITHKYCSDISSNQTSSRLSMDRSHGSVPRKKLSNNVNDDSSFIKSRNQLKKTSNEPSSKESSPARSFRRTCESRLKREGSMGKSSKEFSPSPSSVKGLAGRRSKEASPSPSPLKGPTGRRSKEASPSPSLSKVQAGRRSKETSPSPSPPKGPQKLSATDSGQSKNRIVRRNSSLKRNCPEELRNSMKAKKERKDSEGEPGAVRDETVVQDDTGWTRTKTTVRRARLGSGDKAQQIVRTNSGKTRKEKNFKANASQALEKWAADTTVQGKLVKKEGQRFSHETEEEVRGGQRVAKSVVRRVVRRGSRRLSGGGELLTETKETSKTGGAKDGGETPEESAVVVASEDDGVSRRMKTSTDGEHYVTHSISDQGGATTYTTQGVNNKTTTSVEVIGGDDFAGRRAVEGKTGHRVVVERTEDHLGRPSTVVKKVTSQSRLIITKTKRKSPVVV
ncbi:hypothetical protein Pcinc_041673 [Petrolisthes cinctipes]|uniref:Uncharacterized protein n=1 Tax=Petrolisthes cinctipes TaxID=88211 RepID=A0AAE1EGQ7_PETCI|nr:hypothetical protein Pcinc_041673 [Petrolisthes cinctipes]